jgi:hypothetical protein
VYAFAKRVREEVKDYLPGIDEDKLEQLVIDCFVTGLYSVSLRLKANSTVPTNQPSQQQIQVTEASGERRSTQQTVMNVTGDEIGIDVATATAVEGVAIFDKVPVKYLSDSRASHMIISMECFLKL